VSPSETAPLDLGHREERSVLPMLREHCRQSKLQLESCLDIGCGSTRFDQWVAVAPEISEPRRYVGLEIDDKIRTRLLAEGLDVRHPFTDEGTAADGDLGVALEIIEHLTEEETLPFLREYLARTRKLFVLSTPNCEYWSGPRGSEGYEHLHYMPDHFLDLHAAPSSPHSHKQAFTPQMLSDVMAGSLPDPSWRYRVYRAWPWSLTDLTRPVTYKLYYKLFALAWRE
jgi:hypothetical protein